MTKRIWLLATSLCVVVAGAALGISVAGASSSSESEEIIYSSDSGDIAVYKSTSDPAVYALEPISKEAAQSVRSITAEKETGSVTEGDLADCKAEDERSEVDADCALMLTAAANDDLEVVPGERSKVRVVPCGMEAAAGEIAGCGSEVSEAEVREALNDQAGE